MRSEERWDSMVGVQSLYSDAVACTAQLINIYNVLTQ
jgi:hypothetical protein